MKEKIVFKDNVPIELCLTSIEGREVGGQSGEEIVYDLEDGRFMCVPQSVRDQLTKKGLKPGEPFSICKQVTDEQGEALVEWVVIRKAADRVPKAIEKVQRKLEAAGLMLAGCKRLTNNTGYQLAFVGGEIVNVFDTGKVSVQGQNSTRARAILGLGTSTPADTNNKSNTADPEINQLKNGSNGSGDFPSKNNGHAKLSYIMRLALEGALDATLAAERHAEQSGVTDRNGDPFRFSNADVRAIGLSMFIEARRRAW